MSNNVYKNLFKEFNKPKILATYQKNGINIVYKKNGIQPNRLYSVGAIVKRKLGNNSVMNLHDAIMAWINRGYREISNRSRSASQNNTLQKWTRAIGLHMRPKNNYKTQYLYRGISAPRGNVRNTSGFTSWTNNPMGARRFAGSTGSVLRINTSKLAGVPVLWLGGREGEYILPPMKIIMSNIQNNVIPVQDVIVNQNSMARLLTTTRTNI